MVERQEIAASQYEAIGDLFGTVRGGDPGLSSNTGKRFARLLKARGDRK